MWWRWEGKGGYRILVRVEAAVVEAAVGAAKAEGVGGAVRVLGPGVAKVDVIHAEVDAAEGGVRGHRVARGPGAGVAGLEGGRDGQHAGEDVIDGFAGAVVVGLGPGDSDLVLGRVGEAGGRGLAEEGDGARAGDVELFVVGAGADEDDLGGVVVREGGDGGLHGGIVCGRVGVGHDERAGGTGARVCLAGLAPLRVLCGRAQHGGAEEQAQQLDCCLHLGVGVGVDCPPWLWMFRVPRVLYSCCTENLPTGDAEIVHRRA